MKYLELKITPISVWGFFFISITRIKTAIVSIPGKFDVFVYVIVTKLSCLQNWPHGHIHDYIVCVMEN